MQFYLNSDISGIVREALEIGLRELAKQLNHEDIYTEVRKKMECSQAWRHSRLNRKQCRRSAHRPN